MATTATISRNIAVLILLWNISACGNPPASATIEIDRPLLMEELIARLTREGVPYKRSDERIIVVSENLVPRVNAMFLQIAASLPAECLVFLRTTKGRDAALKTLSENRIEVRESIVSPGYGVAWEADECELGYAHLRDAGIPAPGGITPFPIYE